MEQQIFEARIKLLLRQWPIIWVGNLLVQAVCAVVLWESQPHLTILLWCGVNVLLFGWRLLMRQQFPAAIQAGHHAIERWAHQYAFSGLICGLVWGAGAWLFFDPQHTELTIFLLVVMIGICAGSLPALSCYSPAYITFTSGVLIPLSMKLWSLDWGYSHSLSVLTLIFFGVNIFYSRNLERTISSSITADLANQKLLEEVVRARDAAEQANRTKSTFLAAASHDLRQPLHAMGLFMESLNNQLTTGSQHQLFKHIQTAHSAMEQMFEALLEISRLETGGVKPVLSHFQLRPVIDDLVTSISEQAQQKGISIKVHHCDAVIHTDSVLLGTILRNLLTNAVKYTEQGGIEICGQIQEGSIRLSIKDSGLGIPADKHQLIFSEYHQLANPERDREKGLGLGLAVVKRTTALLGLPLELDSTPGVGSEFSLQIPLGKRERIPAVTNNIQGHNLKGLHLLLIDDDTDILKGTKGVLNQWGCVVTCAESAKQALFELNKRERPPDLIISDYRLQHGVTGLEAIKTIRDALDPELPALLITGDTDPALREQLVKAGYYVLNKPIKPTQLKNVLAELLG